MLYDYSQIAQVLHATIREIQIINGEPVSPLWNDLTQPEQEDHASELQAFHESGTTPKEDHEAWMRSRLASGWVYGPEKNNELKTSPWLVPYEDLPWKQLIKDAVRVSIIREMTSDAS